jgi:hypothetical protein
MAANYTAHKALALANRRMADFDPGVDTPAIVDLDPTGSGEMLAISDGYRRFVAGLFHSVGTGNIDAFEIIAATDADGTGAVVVAEHAFAAEANAVGDTVWLECDVEQVREVLATATHIGVRVEQATAGDECVIYFERSEPTFAYAGLTADTIA